MLSQLVDGETKVRFIASGSYLNDNRDVLILVAVYRHSDDAPRSLRCHVF